jgi:hypothetical protein
MPTGTDQCELYDRLSRWTHPEAIMLLALLAMFAAAVAAVRWPTPAVGRPAYGQNQGYYGQSMMPRVAFTEASSFCRLTWFSVLPHAFSLSSWTSLQPVRCYGHTKFERINYYFKSKILQNNRGTLAIPTLYKLVVNTIYHIRQIFFLSKRLHFRSKWKCVLSKSLARMSNIDGAWFYIIFGNKPLKLKQRRVKDLWAYNELLLKHRDWCTIFSRVSSK